MKTKTVLFTVMLVLSQVVLFAQSRTIKGTIKDSKTNETLPGVTVVVDGTTNATTTDIKGEFTINVEGEGKKLVISSVGYITQVIPADKDVIDVSFVPNTTLLKETVVTALGISREKKTLGYATQEISGDQLTDVKSGNFINQMSGKIAGVQVKNSGNLGGSTNIVIRGTTSMLGNNQALFIVDGVPIDNTSTNSNTTNAFQNRGDAGYDYGSPVSDINPEDIESMNVLKGGAATALYGARAANGVVIITTKKGRAAEGRKRFGVSLNSNLTVGVVDKSTFPKYQNKYGAGYGPYYSGPGNHWFQEDVNGDGNATELVVPYTEDASFGAAFDPNLMVYQWDAFVPGNKNYHKATPWVAAEENGPISFFKKAVGTTNGATIEGASEKGTFRVSYTNGYQTGILPNSSLKKHNVGFNGGLDLTDKFNVGVQANYVSNASKGRNETGYNNNIMSNFRQWWETNVNVVDLKEAYEDTKANYTWNPASSSDPTVPIFWDNPYFQRYESYETDKRDRTYGNVTLNYKINSMVSLLGRAAIDQYAYLQEERVAIGSVPKAFGIGGLTAGSGYSRLNKNFRETNLDFMAKFQKYFGEDLSVFGLLGTNVRRNHLNTIYASTNGGLEVPRLYSISNSKEAPNASVERDESIGVNGFFANASLGYKRFLFLDGTARQDYSSTLPEGHTGFFYPGISGSFVFSEKLKQFTWMDFGKLRVNWAKVGNDAPYGSVKDIYAKPISYGSTTLFSLPNTKNNENLQAELSRTQEAGLEMIFFKRRLGFDFSVYDKKTDKQIVPVAVSPSTGYSSKFVNAGVIQNRGIELTVYGTPVKTKNFSWTVQVNFAKNKNKVLELFEGVDNLQITNFQGGVTLNATLGEAYGTLKGTDYVYNENGQKVVGADGYYKRTTTTDNVIGNVNPDYNAGINNTFNYKNWALSFLIDMQKGGDVYSLDLYYGMATGLYEETAGTNDLGNPVRNTLANGGGVILEGVTETGAPNTKRVAGDDYRLNGYARNPNKAFIYDASYVKLREVVISYKVPFKDKSFFTNATIGLVGSNLWIIFKNLPYADPEAGLTSGNVQGYQTGVMPTTRNFGLNLKLQF